MAASVRETMDAINRACRAAGGHFAEYNCCVVSWDDVSRGTVGSSLSCWGANITDTYLKSRYGKQLFTVRSDNWNERLGIVNADEVTVMAERDGEAPQLFTLRSVLQQLGQFGGYAGLRAGVDLSDASLDSQCSIRFQTTFLPVEGADGRGSLEFAAEAYNYNTVDDRDPRNLILLCTSQGLAVQQDGTGAKRLFHHSRDRWGAIHRHWLEAEESMQKVGGAQHESAEERAEAASRGKATASTIGTRAMGPRFNVLMTIQVPLEQARPEGRRQRPLLLALFSRCLRSSHYSSSIKCDGDGGDEAEVDSEQDFLAEASPPAVPVSRSSAARVSRGSEHDIWPGLSVKAPRRNRAEHVTVTVVMYNAVRGGVPSAEDVLAAIDDLEQLYRACSGDGRLADNQFDFMKKPLTSKDMWDITGKLQLQPHPMAAAST